MQPKIQIQASDLSLEGLEELLEDSPVSVAASGTTAGAQVADAQDWTVEETSRALGLTRGAIIRRLEDGILPGYKVRRANSWVWRVKPVWLPETREKHENEAKTADEAAALEPVGEKKESADADRKHVEVDECIDVLTDCTPEEEEIYLPSARMAGLQELMQLRAKLEMTEFQFQDSLSRLSAANQQIGYLQAKLENSEEKLRLLVDSEKNSPWWNRWRLWFGMTQ